MTHKTLAETGPRFNHVIAFDVAKATLDVHNLPSGRGGQINNTTAAVRRLLKQQIKLNARHQLGAMLVVCESTGGYECHVLAVAHELGLACHRAHGSSLRAYAKYRGTHAKTDPLDARLLAEYGRDKPDLRFYRPPRPAQERLRALMGRRDHLMAMIGAERCRLAEQTDKTVRASIKNVVTTLEREFTSINRDIDELMRADADFARQNKLMQSLDGVGDVIARTVLAFMPELGTMPGTSAAALAGLAPFANQSGRSKSPSHIIAGRGRIRRALYMGAMAAIRSSSVFREIAARLTARGKPHHVVITAVMRKMIVILNAILRDGQPWKQARTT